MFSCWRVFYFNYCKESNGKKIIDEVRYFMVRTKSFVCTIICRDPSSEKLSVKVTLPRIIKLNSAIKGDWSENELGRGLRRGFHITTKEVMRGTHSRQSWPSNFRLRCSPLVRHTNEAISKIYETCKAQCQNGVPVRFTGYFWVENWAVITTHYRPSLRHGPLGARSCERNS
jgi:hypothetical protein